MSGSFKTSEYQIQPYDGKTEVWVRNCWDNGQEGDQRRSGKNGVMAEVIVKGDVAKAAAKVIVRLHERAHGYRPKLASVVHADGTVTVILSHEGKEASGSADCRDDLDYDVLRAALAAGQQASEALLQEAAAAAT